MPKDDKLKLKDDPENMAYPLTTLIRYYIIYKEGKGRKLQ